VVVTPIDAARLASAPVTRRIATALICLVGLLALPALAAADEAEPLFDPSAVAEIDFTLPPASLQKLEEEPETDEYQHAEITVKVGGVTHTLADVGFRLKGGHGSFRELTGKAAFKVKFAEFVKKQKLLGLKKLTLNNMVQDPSMTHETLTYELFRAMGLPAPRTGYASVRINGTLYGTYLNLETYDDTMLPRFFATTQHLYEADAAGVDVRTGEAGTFEVDEGDDVDISDLETLIEAVNKGEGDWSSNVSPFADLGEMTRAWAVERYVAHWDGYAGTDAPFRPNNYYLHSDEAGVFATMPWGTDQTWEPSREVEFDETAGGLMFNECMGDASCRQLYLEGLSEVRCTALDADAATHAAQLAAMLAPYQDVEDEARRESSPEDIAAELEEVESFAAVRPGQLEDFLVDEGIPDACPPPEPEKQSQPKPAPSGDAPQPPAAITAKIRRSHLKGAVVVTPVDVTGTASLRQRVRTRIDGKVRRLCSDRSQSTGPGRSILRCRLPGWALDRLADEPLKLAVAIDFFPEFGSSRHAIRGVTARQQ
jgi:spore coat protein CotH